MAQEEEGGGTGPDRGALKLYQAVTGREYEPSYASSEAIPRRFYCEWELPIDLPWPVAPHDPERRCCFNHYFGLPTRKWETENAGAEEIHVALTSQNRRMMDDYLGHTLLSFDKARGSGNTEMFSTRLLTFKYGAVNTIPNHMGAIMPGTSQKLAHEISGRIKAVCDVHPQIYDGGVPPNAVAPSKFYFADKGRIVLTSATPDAVRGLENVGDIILEEVAHWELLDDMPVYYAVHGVQEKTQCHVIHNTTPRSRRGFYYDLVWSPQAHSSYFRRVINWRQVVGLPVMEVEDLYDRGPITDAGMAALRKELVERYDSDLEYREWYRGFSKGGVRVFWEDGTLAPAEYEEGGSARLIPITETVDVPVPLLDINSIIADSQSNRLHYDQELDNEFISGANRAIGDIAPDDASPDDLGAVLEAMRAGEGEGLNQEAMYA